jgi:penicillin-binding protein 1A
MGRGMASRRRKDRSRREPVFDASPAAALDLRLEARDRPAGAPEAKPEGERRRRVPSERTRRSDPAPERPARRGGKGSGGRKGRSRGIRLVYWAVVLALWLVIAAIAATIWVGAHLPPIQSLEVPPRPPSIEILGADGRVLATRGDMGGAAVPLKELPAYLPQAFIAIEDRRFYSHHGVDPLGIARALAANVLRRGVSQGGSTLTQQLAKNLFLTQERTIGRKVQELVLALWLEHKFTKAQILELYLNRVYFGAGAYGVEAASQRYFGKSARKVTLGEAAMLAGLVKSPSRLSPTHNADGAQRRGQVVLAAMADLGVISDRAAKEALADSPRIVRQVTEGSGNYVADWVMDVLNDLMGRVEHDIVVETTIDSSLQAVAEKALADELAQKGERYRVGQGAVVAMTPDGAVRALVGGRNYADSQFNRAVAAKRQPGSAFKPFVYLTALERGLTPNTVRDDRPIDLKGWRPENYHREYLGPVTLTRALAQSLNTVSVRLALEVGPRTVVRTAHRLGIASKLDPNPSIALGTSDVSVIEMVAAYAPFANGGMAVTPHVVERVRSPDGKFLYRSNPADLGRVVDERHVAMMNQMMQETLISGTARTAQLPGWQAAGKTGTSQDFRDAWFIGYTSHLVTGVWLGNDDNTPTRKTTGGGLPVEIWNRFMKAAHQNVRPTALPGAATPGWWPFSPPPVASGGPPAPQPTPVRDERLPPQSGIDGWLLDRLFGRR